MRGEQKDQRMTIGVVITTRKRLIVETRMNIINHSYIQVLDVWELEKGGETKKRRIQIINIYGNHLCANQVRGQVGSISQRTALADTT